MVNEVIERAAEAQILRAMLDDPSQARYADDLMQATGLDRDTLYPALVDLDRAGLVIMEPGPDERAAERSRHITYRLHPDAIDDVRTRVMAPSPDATCPAGSRASDTPRTPRPHRVSDR